MAPVAPAFSSSSKTEWRVAPALFGEPEFRTALKLAFANLQGTKGKPPTPAPHRNTIRALARYLARYFGDDPSLRD